MEGGSILDLTEEDVEQLDAQACKAKLRELYADRQRRDDYTERLQEKQKALINEVAARREEIEEYEEQFYAQQAKNRERKRMAESGPEESKPPEEMVRDTMETALFQMGYTFAPDDGGIYNGVDESSLIVSKAPKEQHEELAAKDAVLITFHPTPDVEYYLTFRCDRGTTIRQLLQDACRYWGTSDVDFVLKNGASKVLDTLLVTEAFQPHEPFALHLVKKPIRNTLVSRAEELAAKPKVGADAAGGDEPEEKKQEEEVAPVDQDKSYEEQLQTYPGFWTMMSLGEHEEKDMDRKKHLPKLKLSLLLWYSVMVVTTFLSFAWRVSITGQEYWAIESLKTPFMHPEISMDSTGLRPGLGDIRWQRDLWDWLEITVPAVLFEQGSRLRQFNHPVGRIAVAQERSQRTGSCPAQWAPMQCNDAASTAEMADLKFQWVNNTNRTITRVNATPWHYRADRVLPGIVGVYGTYNQIGYGIDYSLEVDDLEGSLADYKGDMAFLKENNWVDDLTRALAIHFVVFNGNWEYWLAAMLYVEVLPGGLMRPHSRVFSFQPDLSLTEENQDAVLIDWIRLCVGVIGFFATMYAEITHEHLLERSAFLYIRSLRFLADVLIFAGTVVVVSLRNIGFGSSNPNFVAELLTTNGIIKTAQAYNSSWLYVMLNVVDSVTVAFLMYRVVNFMRVNRRVYIIWKSITGAFSIMFTFSWVFLPCIFGFVFIARAFLGSQDFGFSSWIRTGGTLVAMLNGEINALAVNEYRIYTVVFLLSFTLMFMVFLLNVFTAIFIRTFHEARVEFGYFPAKYAWKGEDYARYFFWGWVRRLAHRLYMMTKKAPEEEDGEEKKDI